MNNLILQPKYLNRTYKLKALHSIGSFVALHHLYHLLDLAY